jgi:flagellar motor switch protein FliG
VGEPDQAQRTGFRDVAELMNRLDPNTAREILDNIEREEPKLAISIRDLMFTFDDFLEVPEQELRELMNSIDKKTLDGRAQRARARNCAAISIGPCLRARSK